MANKLARRTISRIEQSMEEGRSTAISEIIQIIQELANRAFSISVSELSELVGRDPTITERVISAANTLGFNPSGTPIATISESIHTVGFEKIRNLAISLLLVESAGQTLNSFEQREIAALSVCSGLLAQRLARERRSSVDLELLFVCSSLRNYGRLLMSTFLVEQYRQARSLALEMDSEEAFKRVFGLTPLALGRHLLQSTTLPRSIMAALREFPREKLEFMVNSEENEILAMAELSGALCSVVFDENVVPESFNESLSEVLRRFEDGYPVALEAVNQALIGVEAEYALLNRLIGLPEEASTPAQKLRARVSGVPLPPSPTDCRIRPPDKPKPYLELDPAERERFAEESYQRAASRIAHKLTSDERIELKEIYQIACYTIMEGLDLESCMAFVREDFEPESLSARFGCGPLYEKIKNRPLVSPRNKDIFSLCLARKEDILIQDTQAGKIRSVVPDWIHSRGEVGSFTLLPALEDRRLFAIIVGIAKRQRVIDIKDGDRRRLRAIRFHLATARQVIQQRPARSP